MPWIGLEGSVRAAGFTTSLAPITRATSVRLNSPLIVVHFEQLVVGDIGLGQKHVHVPRHSPGDGMNGEFHLAAAGLDLLGQLADLVLGMGDRHAVAGDHDHAAGIGKLNGRIFNRDAADRFAFQRFGRAARRRAAAERAEQHVRERAVHCPAHEDREDETARAVERAGDDEHVVSAGRTRWPTTPSPA